MVNVWGNLLEVGVIRKTIGKSVKKTRHEDEPKIPKDVLMAFKDDFNVEGYVESHQFPILHQIVMGLVDADLETPLKLSTDEIDNVDQQGLTALNWAATTGNVHSLETPLRYGADPNTIAFNGDAALHNAVRTPNLGCVEQLIRYKANLILKMHG